MMKKRAELDMEHPPGQIVNTEELDKMAYKSHPKTLGDYIDNVLAEEAKLDKQIKKLSFDEWWALWHDPNIGMVELSVEKCAAKAAWKAAKENI